MITRTLVFVSGASLIGFAFLSSFSGVAPAPDSSQFDADKVPTPQLAAIESDRISLTKVLTELASQTSESVEDQRGEAVPDFALDLQKVPFWQALDAIADKTDSRVDLHARDGRVALVKRPAGWKPPPISHSGLFRTALTTLTAKIDLETDARTYTASIEVAWEPHLLPILLETRPQSVVVRDDANHLVPAGSAGSSLAPVDGRISLPIEVTLPPLSRSVRTLSLLEGQLYVVAPTKMLTFTFDSLDQLAKAPAGDPRLSATQEKVVCQVSRVVAADDHWSVEITLDYPEGNVKLDSYQSWVVNNEMVLEHGADRLPSSSYLLEESTPRHAVLTYNFSDREKMKNGLRDWKLVYRTPALVIKVPLTFSFKNVPLP